MFDQFGVPGTEKQYLTRTNGFAPPLGTPPLPLPRPLEQVPARKHLLPPHCPIISISKIFKIVPKGCERSQTEEGCLLNAFSEFLRKKNEIPGWGSRGFPSPMGAQGGFRAQIGDFTRHLTRAPRGPWPILPPCTCPGDISLALGPPGYHARPRYRAEKGLK